MDELRVLAADDLDAALAVGIATEQPHLRAQVSVAVRADRPDDVRPRHGPTHGIAYGGVIPV